MTVKLGLVVALPAEMRALIGRGRCQNSDGFPVRRIDLRGGHEIICIRSGVGMDNALRAARILVRERVRLLVSAGVSGGLRPGLQPGTLIIAGSVFEHRESGETLTWSPGTSCSKHLAGLFSASGLCACTGQVISTPRPVLSAEDKRLLYQHTGASAVDLESAAVARAACDAECAFYALRAVCDSAEQAVPDEIVCALQETGQIRLRPLIQALAKRPQLGGDLYRLGRNFSRALAVLHSAWALQVKNGFNDFTGSRTL